MEATGRTALYRLYDTEDRLLYIGISVNPDMRWVQHANEKLWWPCVARREVAWFETRPEACEAEVYSIQTEQPIYNVADSPDAQWGDAKQHRKAVRLEQRGVRVPDDEWDELVVTARQADTSAAAVIRQAIRKYIGRPGAEWPRVTPSSA